MAGIKDSNKKKILLEVNKYLMGSLFVIPVAHASIGAELNQY